MSKAADNESFARLVQVWLRKRGTYHGEIDGWAGTKTQDAFERAAAALSDVAGEVVVIGHGFVGDLDWIHRHEGHRGRPYWPGGASGITLDPGLDLGHCKPAAVAMAYGTWVHAACEPAFGIRGAAAARLSRSLPAPLAELRISRDQARAALPIVARPYWLQISDRFPGLRDAPGPVQTAMLSLAYNRGPGNRHLEPCRDPIVAGSWDRLADVVASMQQEHRLAGIRRRRREEAELIRLAHTTARRV